jgi:hypothetical protein
MCLSHSDSRQWFVSGSIDATARLWDYRVKDTCVKVFQGHDSDINAISFFHVPHLLSLSLVFFEPVLILYSIVFVSPLSTRMAFRLSLALMTIPFAFGTFVRTNA